MYQKKKDKKQLVSKRDGAQSNNPVLQYLDFVCKVVPQPSISFCPEKPSVDWNGLGQRFFLVNVLGFFKTA